MGYKLYYFNLYGVGEPIRFLLKYGGVEFEDVRIESDEWPGVKETMPWKTLPVLEIDGKRLTQSTAICRFLAAKYKLTGNNESENFDIDTVVDTFTDLKQKVVTVAFGPEDVKKASTKNLHEEILPFYLSKLNAIAEKNDGHMACKRLTWADFYAAALKGVIKYGMDADPFEKYPGLMKVAENVESIDAIKKWIAERPVTML